MRIEEIRVEEGSDDQAAIEEAANQWLQKNSPRGCPFNVLAVTSDGQFWTVAIQSPGGSLGAIDPAEFEKRLENALGAKFPGETFIASGAQRPSTKRSALRGKQ